MIQPALRSQRSDSPCECYQGMHWQTRSGLPSRSKSTQGGRPRLACRSLARSSHSRHSEISCLLCFCPFSAALQGTISRIRTGPGRPALHGCNWGKAEGHGLPGPLNPVELTGLPGVGLELKHRPPLDWPWRAREQELHPRHPPALLKPLPPDLSGTVWPEGCPSRLVRCCMGAGRKPPIRGCFRPRGQLEGAVPRGTRPRCDVIAAVTVPSKCSYKQTIKTSFKI